jgi:hypothetical protein
MARYDLTRFRGDTDDLVFKLTSNGAPVPLAGCSAVLSVSSEENPAVATYEFQSNAVVDAQAGTLSFPFTPTQVDLVGEYYFDVQLTDADGKTKTLRKAKITFKQDITKE